MKDIWTKSITNSKQPSPGGGYTALANIEELFKKAILINETEYAGNGNNDDLNRIGNNYLMFFIEFSFAGKDYLARIVVESEKKNSNKGFEPNVHKVKSFDVTEIEGRKKEVIQKAGKASNLFTSKISVEQLIDDVIQSIWKVTI